MTRLSPQELTYRATNDQSQGGNSTSFLEVKDQKFELVCELKASPDYSWPYCGISLQLGELIDKGLNLENYHTVRLNVDFEQLDSSVAPTLRFYLRNFNPAYSVVENDYTHKYNGVEYAPGSGNGAIEIPLRNLQVLTWWLADNKIPIEHAGPEFSNVTMLELATGSGHHSGQYRMTVHSIEFIGRYISGEQLMFGLLVFWVSLALVYALVEIQRSRYLVGLANARQQHLSKLNKELKEQNVYFAELANRDALTGVMNRHSIRDWLDSQYDSASTQQKIISVLYLDIDLFKQVNDTYGHSIGDDILREFTMVVMSAVSPSERVVRWGGEEFVVFAPGRDITEADSLAERIRLRVESHIWVHGDPLTTSIGVAQLREGGTSDMLARADEALYDAKRSGRNRVVTDWN